MPDETRPADFTVGTTVVAPSPERFGANLTYPDTNNWTSDPSFEPFNLRLRGNATGGGPTFILNEQGPTTSYFDCIVDHFFDGARIRVYRVVLGQVQHVRTDTIAAYWATANSGYRIDLASNGPDVMAGDVYFVDTLTDAPPVHLAHPRLNWIPYWDTWRMLNISGGTTTPANYVRDPSSVPPGGGRTSLRVDAAAGSDIQISQYRYGWRGFVYEPLEEGRTYRVSVWLRQEGLASGQVRFWMTSIWSGIQHTFTGVDGTWRQYTWDFVAPATANSEIPVVEHAIGFTGPGRVWFDEFLIYDPAEPPLAMNERALQALRDYDGDALRIWSGQTNTEWGTTLESWTSREGQSRNTWRPNEGRSVGPLVNLPLALDVCEETAMTPWLILGPYFDEEELLGLMEFLAGPTTTTWGARRLERGRSAPWTDAFGKIRIEFANEAWNWFFHPWDFDSTRYGAFAEHCFSTLKSSPFYAAVADKFEFILNGWTLSSGTGGYGADARRYSPSADWVDLTSYTGGWEAGGTIGGGTVTDQGFLDTLTFLPRFHQSLLDAQVATRTQMVSQGYPYGLAVYEGGPGYSLPSANEPFNVVQEAYGKSLANAVATLDCFLYGSQSGFGPQAYFGFSPGYNWTSHTYPSMGYRAHASWLALQLRNRYAQGDMVRVATSSVPTRDFPATQTQAAQSDVPMATCYAFRNGNRFSVIAMSRRLSGGTNVTLRLPFASISGGALHRLEGDPRATNNTSNELAIQSSPIGAFNRNFTFDLPAGSIYLYVFEGASVDSPVVPAVTVNQGPTQDDPTSFPLIRFQAVFSQPVTGFDSSDVVVGGTAGATDVSVSEVAPLTGNVYEIQVSGMIGSGTVTASIPAGRATGPGGQSNTASTSWDGSVQFNVPIPENRLYLYDGFDLLPREAPNPTYLDGVTTGSGFAIPWYVQNFNPNDAEGYRLRSESPLLYPGLLSRGGYAVGGYVYVTAGRLVDVPSFGLYQVLNSNPPQVGQTGLTLWASCLLRKEAANDEPVYFSLSRGPYAQGEGDLRILVGYFGAESNFGGHRYWSLAIRNAANTGFEVVRSNVPIVTGETSLLVWRMAFGGQDQISLFVNPASLGGGPPGVPNAQANSTVGGTNLEFRTLGFYGGNSLDQGSGDEVRIGDSYAAVTPMGARVNGSATLRDLASPTDVPVTVEIRDGAGTLLDTTRVPLRSDGSFVLVSSAQGTVRVSAKGAHWLRHRRSGVVLDANVPVSLTFDLFNGDVNGDNSVNIADFVALRVAFGSSPGGGNWNPNADLNHDGSVNVADFLVLRRNLGRSGDAA